MISVFCLRSTTSATANCTTSAIIVNLRRRGLGISQVCIPNVKGLGPLENPKEGVFIISKLVESLDIFRPGESVPESCRLICDENFRGNVPELKVDKSFGEVFAAGLGDPLGLDRTEV